MSCNARILEIVSGVPKAIGDANSANEGLSVLSLLQGQNDEGFSVDTWQPAIAGSKPNSIWADSAISAGRTLISSQDANPVETLQLVCTASTHTLLATRLQALYRFRELAQEYWESDWQFKPLYLKWQAKDAPGPQYALIYTMDIAVTYPDVEEMPVADVTLTVEREPYWRALPPGQNPKVWTLGLATDVSNLKLWTGTDHLHYEQIQNRQELNTDYVTPITKNYIDVPASKIPGDAPALVLIDWLRKETSLSEDMTVFIARNTKPITRSSHPTVKTHKTLMSLNGGDESGAGTGVTKVLDATRGVISNGSTTNKYYVNVTFSANPQTRTVIWGSGASLFNLLDQNTLQGQYAFFLRHKQNAGAVGDITVQLEVRINSGNTSASVLYASVALPAVPTTVLDAVMSTDFYVPLYLGSMSIPFSDNLISSLEGWGLDVVRSGQFSLEVRLNVTRSTGVASLYFVDLIMLPFDEALVELHPPNEVSGRSVAVGDFWHMVYDNTGYMGHGDIQPGGYTVRATSSAADTGYVIELLGNELTLMPGMDNRLFFFSQRYNAQDNVIISRANEDQFIRLNIIPRWKGIRTE